jgi:hypothetical protein
MFPLIISLLYVVVVTAYPQHAFNQHRNNLNKRVGGSQDWTYEASHNWSMINSRASPPTIYTQLTLFIRLHTLPNPRGPITNNANDNLRPQTNAPCFTAGYTSLSLRHTLQLGLQPCLHHKQHGHHLSSLYDI